MKTLFSFLFVLMFLLGYGQKPRDTITLERYLINEKEIGTKNRKEILQDFKGLDYSELIKLIMRDIDFNLLKSKNIVFNFDNTCSLIRDGSVGSILYSKDICDTDSENPAFNQTHFWTLKTILKIQKKYHKNLIPYLKFGLGFVTDNSEFENFDENIKHYYFDDSKKIIDDVKKEAKGIFIENYKDRIYKKTFYYFRTDNKELILTMVQGKSNFDKLHLSFRNFKNRIVVVKFEYQDDGKPNYISYIFHKTKWNKIPTKKEHEF